MKQRIGRLAMRPFKGMDTRAGHLNLIQASRQLFELDPGAEVESGDGWMLGAGRSTHPVISNAAFRVDDSLDPTELLERARAFFAARDRGYALWARGETPADEDLIDAARAAGLEQVYEMPEMMLDRRAEGHAVGDGIELRRVESAADAEAYWRVAADAYTSIGFPPEVFAFYESHAGMWADNAAAFLARLDGTPAAIAMTIVSHGVAGIYWVGATEPARRRGLGWALTARAVNAGFELGAESASLQASSMGEGLYERMGFEKVCSYRLLLDSVTRRSRTSR